MKKTGIVILTIALIAAICGSFYVVNDKSKRANQKEKVLTEVQRITTKDLDKNYPQTPREVVKFYNRIVKCYYGLLHFLPCPAHRAPVQDMLQPMLFAYCTWQAQSHSPPLRAH